MVELQELADALNSLKGWRAGLTDLCKFLWAEFDGRSFTWAGIEENPALCFAILDALEKASILPRLSTYWGTHANEAPGEPHYVAATLINAYDGPWAPGATRTEAVALVLIRAHKKGLLSADVTVQGGGV